MRLTDNELGEIISALDSLQSDELEIDYKIILRKLSKELKERGYTTIVSKHYIR